MKNVLLPLSETCNLTSNDNGILDPTSQNVDNFLLTQPRPMDGAICYIAVTGELVNNKHIVNGFC